MFRLVEACSNRATSGEFTPLETITNQTYTNENAVSASLD